MVSPLRRSLNASARKGFNDKTGSKRLFSHALFTPGMPGWLEEMDRAISELSPDSWKGYTVGAPSTISEFPWRLDDEKLVYTAYEKMIKAGISNVCIHRAGVHITDCHAVRERASRSRSTGIMLESRSQQWERLFTNR